MAGAIGSLRLLQKGKTSPKLPAKPGQISALAAGWLQSPPEPPKSIAAAGKPLDRYGQNWIEQGREPWRN